MREPSGRREYHGAGRQAASAATRQAILDAARESMIRRGYRATRIADVAAAAGVHVATVYELVGRKPVLLRELIEQAISGVDHAVPADDRDYVVEMRAEPDPARQLTIYAAAMRAIQARLAPLLVALRDAATTDTDAAAVWHDISARRAANMRRLVEDVAATRGLRAGLTVDDAADFVWLTNSPEVYILLTTERNWSAEHYERWLADLWRHHLLPPTRVRSRGRGPR